MCCSGFFSLQLHAFKLSDVPTEGFCPPAWGLCHSCGHKGPWDDWSIQPWSLWEEVSTLRKDARSRYGPRDSPQSRHRRGAYHGDVMRSFAPIHSRPDGQQEQLQLRLPPRRLRGQEGPAVVAVTHFRQPGCCYCHDKPAQGHRPPAPLILLHERNATIVFRSHSSASSDWWPCWGLVTGQLAVHQGEVFSSPQNAQFGYNNTSHNTAGLPPDAASPPLLSASPQGWASSRLKVPPVSPSPAV